MYKTDSMHNFTKSPLRKEPYKQLQNLKLKVCILANLLNFRVSKLCWYIFLSLSVKFLNLPFANSDFDQLLAG